jgi:hypothetical protein
VLVRGTFGATMIDKLGADIAQACATLGEKGPVHPAERERHVKTNTGF